jgi:two-component system sensor histidine kinase AgrC
MILDYFYTLIITALLLYVLESTANVSLKWKKRIIFVLAYGFIMLVLNNVNMVIKLILFVVAFVELSHRYLKIDYYKAIISGILGILFTIIADLSAGLVLHNLVGFTIAQVRENASLAMLVYLIMTPVVVIVTQIYKKLNRIIGISEDSNNRNSIVSLAYIIIILIFMGLLGKIYSLIPRSEDSIYLALFFSLLILFVSLNFVVLYINNRYLMQKNEYEQLKIYTGIVEDLVTDIKKFRHDYVNIIYSINGFIENEDLKNLKMYFNDEIIKDSSILYNNNNMLQLQNLKNPAIKGLVSSKIVQAENLGLHLTVEIENEIKEIPVRTLDMCRILGVLIDNGIEAAVESEKKKMNIGMMDDGENVILIIANTYKNLPKISDMFKEGFSTKGVGRGIGLSTIKATIDANYKNIIFNSFNQAGIFKQEINIKRNK